MTDKEQWLEDRLEYAERQIELLTEGRDTMGALWASEKQARHATEAKLAEAVDILKRITFTADSNDHDGWYDALNDARYLVAEQEKTK
jgi:cell division septum initiation protein DivIVA